tara:strand:- start:499 stop:717 length:219 start_codon:yes stop_codon:yes gene_type:complete
MESLNRSELLCAFDCIANEIFKKNWEKIITKKLFETEKRAPISQKILDLIDKDKEQLFEAILIQLTEFNLPV